MVFIAVLMLAATAIAVSAAFFSVYGLAHIFAGAFWSVVIMGGSLELGKLVAASYLYRYWKHTGFLLKTYLFIGIAALMLLTSTGILGYLTAGYQSDMIPLKEMEAQIALKTEEKDRHLARKAEIDKQISTLPTTYVSARERLARQFKTEQEHVTNRINQLDIEISEIKQKQIHTEAHVGPIVYLAKVFELDTDNATMYLIYIIIFAFDPMAVALTLAVNIALRVRKEEKEKLKQQKEKVIEPTPEHEDVRLSSNVIVAPEQLDVETDIETPLLNDPMLQNINIKDVAELVKAYDELKIISNKTAQEEQDFEVIKAVLRRHGLITHMS